MAKGDASIVAQESSSSNNEVPLEQAHLFLKIGNEEIGLCS